MEKTTKGKKVEKGIIYCSSLRWAREYSLWPIRLAGTCSKYSKKAMPQEISAAIHHGRSLRCLRCAYQANVMNRFDAESRHTACQITGIFMQAVPQGVLSAAY